MARSANTRVWKDPASQSTSVVACLGDNSGVTNCDYRISGHETFPCRYTWLPKGVRGLADEPKLFADEERAMVDLGVGKNMVRSIRFWSLATGIARVAGKGEGHALTDFGRAVFGKRGYDPFLEDRRTLWLIHWNLSTNVESPLLAWDYLLSRWQEPELVPSLALKALEKEATARHETVSRATVEQHFDAFLHTYVPTRGRKGDVQEDNLDCPLVELELIIKVGDRELDRSAGRREPIYAFRRDEKPDITAEIFTYCLQDFWQERHAAEGTLPLREVAHGHGSPGQVFKLPEEDVRARVAALAELSDGLFAYSESATLQQVRRNFQTTRADLLKGVYWTEDEHV